MTTHPTCRAAAKAWFDALPKTKPAEVRLVAHMNSDVTVVFFVQTDAPDARAKIERDIGSIGGQLVELRGTAQVPA